MLDLEEEEILIFLIYIVSMGKDYFFLMANDEDSNYSDGRFDGLYRLIKVNKKDFESLKDAAKIQNRKKGVNLLKKIHQKNPEKNSHCASIEGNSENFDLKKTFELYQKSEQILK